MFIINWGELEGRVDPEAYHSEVKNAIVALKSKNTLTRLKKIALLIREATTEFDNKLPYIGLECIQSGTGTLLNTLNINSVSGQAYKFIKGDILFPKLRPYLNKVWYAEFDGYCSTEFCVYRTLDKPLDRYLRYFLNSEIIVRQTKHLMCGNTLPRLQIDSIENLFIPMVDKDTQQQIVDIMDAAYIEKQQKEKEAKNLLDSINGYLLGELGIAMPPEEDNTLESRKFYANSADVLGGRFDPRKYTKKYYDIFTAIQNSLLPKKQLREIVLFDVAGNWGLDETEEGSDLISCLTIRATEFDNKYNLDLGNNRTKYRKYKPSVFEKIALSYEDILIEKSGGSDDQPVGRVAFIEKEMTDNFHLAYSNFIHKIIVNKNKADPRFVFEYLRLIHNIKMTQVMQTQTNGIRNLIMGEYFSQPIVLPDKEIQRVIACKASSIRNEAKLLEKEAEDAVTTAKAKVEKILLKGSL